MSITSVFILIIVVLVVSVIIIIASLFSFLRKLKQNKDDDKSLLMLQNQIQHINNTLDTKLSESRDEMQKAVYTQFSESQKLIKDITAQVAQVQESNKQIFTVGDQLQNLEKVLKNQKQRGNLGEASLELILSNILPPTAYKIQYEFKNGDAVDSVILTKDGMIPVDAKFSLDNYNRIINEINDDKKEELEKDFKNDLKKRIDETAKYIRPQEGTLPFAFMFIPAEGIYYDLLVNEVGSVKVNTRSLIDYAYKDKNVIIVSPTTFAAYLQSVLYGFRAFKIEESAREIRKRVEDLSTHLKKYDEFMKKLGGHLGTTVNAYSTAYKELGKVDKDILKITDKSANIEPLQVEQPKIEE